MCIRDRLDCDLSAAYLGKALHTMAENTLGRVGFVCRSIQYGNGCQYLKEMLLVFRERNVFSQRIGRRDSTNRQVLTTLNT